MRIIFRNIFNKFIHSFQLKELEHSNFLLEEITGLHNPSSAILISSNERVHSHKLESLKVLLLGKNINISHIYSTSRETVLTGKSLRINSTLIKTERMLNELFSDNKFEEKDLFYKGTVRSGNRISSNGDLIILGDVNPGAIVTANKNVYVWGKLLGIALAGESGDRDAFITSLYLKPLQLRICEVVAIGPKENPKYQYPEVAVLENNSIIIKPYIVGS